VFPFLCSFLILFSFQDSFIYWCILKQNKIFESVMKTERQTDIKSEIVSERERESVCVCVYEREREMALPESGILVRLKFTRLSQVQNTTK
jgi:hypothetical protein